MGAAASPDIAALLQAWSGGSPKDDALFRAGEAVVSSGLEQERAP